MNIDRVTGIIALIFAVGVAIIGPLIAPAEVGKVLFFALIIAACGMIGLFPYNKGAGG